MIGWNYEARQDRVLRAILPLSVCIVGLLACARPSDAIDFYEIEIYDTDTTPAGHLQLELHSNTTSTATGQLAKSQIDVYQVHETVEATYSVPVITHVCLETHGLTAQWALARAIGHTQAFCPPKPMDALVVDRPAGVSGGPGGASPTPAGTAQREVTQESTQGKLFVTGHWCREALGGASLADQAARPSF